MYVAAETTYLLVAVREGEVIRHRAAWGHSECPGYYTIRVSNAVLLALFVCQQSVTNLLLTQRCGLAVAWGSLSHSPLAGKVSKHVADW